LFKNKDILLKSFLISILFSFILLGQANKDQPEGWLLSSKGTINVLFVFAQFPDDNYQPDNPLWRKNDPPQRVKDKTWVDEKWTGNPTPWSMTDYFNEMSFGKFRFIGKSVSVIAPHTRQWYVDNKMKYGAINADVLKVVDKDLDFAEFDNYTRKEPFKIFEGPDSQVDMILFVWRNIHLDLPPEKASETFRSLGFGWFGSTGINNLPVDNGKRSVRAQSGVTIQDFFSKDAFRFSVHEFAHYLIGGNEFHNGLAFWAVLNGYASRSFMINSFERHMLGWITLKDIPKGSDLTDIKLKDYVTTGDAARIEINPKKHQYFYLENHQRISKWDETSADKNEKGVYVLRRNSRAGDNKFMQLVPADGRYNWEVIGFEYPEYYKKGVPVFRKLKPNRKEGYTDNEFVPFRYEDKEYQPWEIIFYEDTLTGKPVENPPNRGDGKDAFRPGYQVVFSPWSNPPSVAHNNIPTGIGFYIKNMNNGVADLSVYTDSSVVGPPSKPDRPEISKSGNQVKITWYANEEPDLAGYRIYKISGRDEELIGKTDRNTTSLIYTGQVMGKRDRFRVSSIDKRGEESLKSEPGEWIN
jgi:M6 family metalloprotease-like protein